MIKVLFICHGNICRSPMAEFIMKDLVQKAGLSSQFERASAATSTEEIGNPVYPPARRKLAEHGIDCSGKTAWQLQNKDYDCYDLLIGMDRANLRRIYQICGGKLHRPTMGKGDAHFPQLALCSRVDVISYFLPAGSRRGNLAF